MTMTPVFQKAKRQQTKLKIALTGPSGSGKTYSALRLASGISKKIAYIDTENGSASLYSDSFEFDVINLTPPFTTEKYIQAINAAEKASYEVVVIDSITHAWAGEGGLLEQKEQADARGGNQWANWGKITKQHEVFKSAFLHSTCHIICTMRSKQEYSMSNDDKGKSKIQKLGMAPIQRDGMEYEFTTVFDIAMNHEAATSKDRTGLFADKIFTITEETGEQFLKWMLSGSKDFGVTIRDVPGVMVQNPVLKPQTVTITGAAGTAGTTTQVKVLTNHAPQSLPTIPQEKKDRLKELKYHHQVPNWLLIQYLVDKFGHTDLSTMTEEHCDHLIWSIENQERPAGFDESEQLQL